MKILLISSKYPPEYAGSGLRAHNTYKRLKSKFSIDYDVITDSKEHNDNKTYEYKGVCIKRLSRKLPEIASNNFFFKIINHIIYTLNYLWLGMLTLKEIKRGDYDLIHTFGSSISINVAMLYAKNKNIGLLRELCNEGTYPRPVLPLKLDKIFKYQFWPKSRVVAISKRVADLCRREGVVEMYLWERPNPVDEKKFKPSTETKYNLRKKLTKFADDDKVLVDISKFMPRKNKKFLVEVMKYLEEGYKLLIFGPIISSGPLFERDKRCYDEIINTIKKNKLDDRIQVVTGFSENIQEYFQLADVFVFPTLSEALGTPMLESIACGVPVVASKIEGVTDYWIEEGQTGYTCELEPQKFADCIAKTCRIKPEILRQGSEKILSRASSKVIDEQYFKLMRDMIGSSSN